MPISEAALLLAVLECTYPGYEYLVCGDSPVRFWARRRTPPTARQLRAGVRLYVGRTTLERLADAVSDQSELAWWFRR